jgi:hypothetical protein
MTMTGHFWRHCPRLRRAHSLIPMRTHALMLGRTHVSGPIPIGVDSGIQLVQHVGIVRAGGSRATPLTPVAGSCIGVVTRISVVAMIASLTTIASTGICAGVLAEVRVTAMIASRVVHVLMWICHVGNFGGTRSPRRIMTDIARSCRVVIIRCCALMTARVVRVNARISFVGHAGVVRARGIIVTAVVGVVRAKGTGHGALITARVVGVDTRISSIHHARIMRSSGG